MRKWLSDFFKELNDIRSRVIRGLRAAPAGDTPRDELIYKWGVRAAATALVVVLIVVAFTRQSLDVDRPSDSSLAPAAFVDYTVPVRPEPRQFKRNTALPNRQEGSASSSIGEVPFDPKRDLVTINDSRVWWESDNDLNDSENDHVMHFAMETPFRRLVELVDQAGGAIKVQDAYRGHGIHASKSLHKEGRALDLTAEGITLERLAKLCWAAGFAWVLYEAPEGGGDHIHVSMRPLDEFR